MHCGASGGGGVSGGGGGGIYLAVVMVFTRPVAISSAAILMIGCSSRKRVCVWILIVSTSNMRAMYSAIIRSTWLAGVGLTKMVMIAHEIEAYNRKGERSIQICCYMP